MKDKCRLLTSVLSFVVVHLIFVLSLYVPYLFYLVWPLLFMMVSIYFVNNSYTIYEELSGLKLFFLWLIYTPFLYLFLILGGIVLSGVFQIFNYLLV